METIQTDLKNAPIWKRLVGLLIDTAIIFTIVILALGEMDNPAISYIIGSFLGALVMGPILYFFSLLNSGSSTEFSVFIMLLIYYIYCLLTELAFNNTFGKMIVGIKIISTSTMKKPTSLQYIGRTFSRMIPLDPFSFFHKNPRGWHDSIPKTKVVNK